jgi:hypothetical protein
VGLIQRSIEARGVPTVSVSVARDVTEAIRPLVLFSCLGQWAVILELPSIETSKDGYLFAALKLLEAATESATVRDIPIRWPRFAGKQKKRSPISAVIYNWTRIDSDATLQPPPPPRRAPDLPSR